MPGHDGATEGIALERPDGRAAASRTMTSGVVFQWSNSNAWLVSDGSSTAHDSVQRGNGLVPSSNMGALHAAHRG
jgi:hypothetical protein